MINCSSFLSSSIHSHTTESQGGGYSTFLTLARRRIILVITTIIVCATIIPSPTTAQTPNWMGGIGALCDSSSGVAYYLGRVGVRTATPLVPLHIHSGYCLTGDSTIYPAIERLQTQSNFSTYNFGQSAIQFWSGGLGTGQDWAVSAIKPVSNASPLIFNTGDTTSPDNWLGGMAFYCSALGQRPTGGEIEVMRIVDEKVGIRTPNPLGTLDVNVGTLTANWPKISFASGISSADSCPSPQIRFYSPFSLIETTPDRIKSYSWYIQSLRQYDPACYTNLDGSSQPGVSINTTLGALHIRAGYDPVKADTPSVGDIYSSETGEEESIARMSLLSNGNVGINNEIPMVRFNVYNGAVLFDGEQGRTPLKRVDTSGLVSAQEIGAGTRLMWIPEKAAFRAGKLDSEGGSRPTFPNRWNSNMIGMHSIAMGYNPEASELNCVALGHAAAATDTNAVAIGSGASAYGVKSMALGGWADAFHAVALGVGSRALSRDATAIGNSTWADSAYTNAFGWNTRVFGEHSSAFGASSTVSGNYSMAFGYAIVDSGYNNYSFGHRIRTHASTSYGFTLGFGTTNFLGELSNSVSNSLILGANSNLPSITLLGGSYGSIGNIGIKTTSPCALFSVEGNAIIGSSWAGVGSKAPSANSFVVEDKVGIGTYSPPEALSVVMQDSTNSSKPNTVLIWNTNVPVTDSTIDLRVQEKVVIGEQNIDTTRTLLTVYGNAWKNNGATWLTGSDIRYKEKIEPFTDGLAKIRAIKPVWFNFKGEWGLSSSERQVGIIAQEMQNILPYTISQDSLSKTIITKQENRYEVDVIDTTVFKVRDYSGLDSNGDYLYRDSLDLKPSKKWVVEPMEFRSEKAPILMYNANALFYVLVNSAKELDANISTTNSQVQTIDSTIQKIQQENKNLQSENLILNQRIKDLEDKLQQIQATCCKNNDLYDDVLLEQNIPNPFAKETIITYFAPDRLSGRLELIIADASGNTILQSIPIQANIPSQYTYSATDLQTGVYLYGISLNGQIIKSKKMMILK